MIKGCRKSFNRRTNAGVVTKASASPTADNHHKIGTSANSSSDHNPLPDQLFYAVLDLFAVAVIDKTFGHPLAETDATVRLSHKQHSSVARYLTCAEIRLHSASPTPSNISFSVVHSVMFASFLLANSNAWNHSNDSTIEAIIKFPSVNYPG